MKILYIVNHFKYHGGIERMLSNKIDAWIEECEYEVVVVTINQNNAPVVYPPKNEFKLIKYRTIFIRISQLYCFLKKTCMKI